MRLQEEPFVAAFPPGWHYECVWETVTRQDAELLVKVFRAVCEKCLPTGSELTRLPLRPILHIMDAIVDKAKWHPHIYLRVLPYVPSGRASSSSCPLCSAALTRHIPLPRCASCVIRSSRRWVTRCTMLTTAAAAGAISACCMRLLFAEADVSHLCSVMPPERDQYRFKALAAAATTSPTRRATGFWYCEKKSVVYSAHLLFMNERAKACNPLYLAKDGRWNSQQTAGCRRM